jgi:Ricin-type beta-trefoil lectin domain
VRVGRLLGAFAVLVIMTSTGQPGARAASSGGTTIGPVQISALGHPGLCWQAGGNGSGVTLEHCDRVLQGQQWSLTPDGVLMNGNGYCLEAVPGRPLFIDFAAQCAGASSQLWQHHSGQLTSSVTGASTTGAGAGVCAVTAAPVSPGAEIVGGSCSRPRSAPGTVASPRTVSRWSIGYSAVTVTPGRGRGSAGGAFSASVTVANATSAQAAYGVSVAFTLPPGVSASALHASALHASALRASALRASALRASALRAATASSSPRSGPRAPTTGSGPQAPTTGSGLRCDVGALTCTGTLPAGASRQITLTGPVPAAIRPGDSYPVRVHATVAGTTQRSRTARTTASLTVTVGPAAPRPRSPLPLIAGTAAVLLLAGSLLILTTHRTRTHPPPAPSLRPPFPLRLPFPLPPPHPRLTPHRTPASGAGDLTWLIRALRSIRCIPQHSKVRCASGVSRFPDVVSCHTRRAAARPDAGMSGWPAGSCALSAVLVVIATRTADKGGLGLPPLRPRPP